MAPWNSFAPLAGVLVTALLAAGCRDFVAPERDRPDLSAFSVGDGTAAVTGVGAIGQSLALPTMNRQEFDFDVPGTTGARFFFRDYSVVRTSPSLLGSMTVDPADGATGITSFAQTSARCITFGGIGRVDTGDLFAFSVMACDNGSPGAGLDFLSMSVPDINYDKANKLTDGEITTSGLTKGDVRVTTVSTGSDLDPDGYTLTLDNAMSQAIGPNGTVEFSALAERTYTIELGGLAANCTATGTNPQTVTVVAGSVASTTFDVTCSATTPGGTRVTGRGVIGDGPALPKMDRFELDFDVTSDLSGRVLLTDYRIIRGDGEVAQMTVDPATDPATSITSFTRTSPACVSFGGIGRLNDGGSLYAFFIDACDNASPGAGADTFSINLPDRPYSKSGTLTEGDIAISTF